MAPSRLLRYVLPVLWIVVASPGLAWPDEQAGHSWVSEKVPESARKFWSFRPLRAVAPPAVDNPAWCNTPVDRFILAAIENNDISPNRAAEKRTLIRRAYFDLLGLPPEPDEVEGFVRDTAPDAYSRLIDRLLHSPHYGERWGRHWLDLARFAESHGFEHDTDRPTAFHYRNFVIRALNADMPYDRFVRLQLAGDELAPDDPLALMATGFLAAGVHSTQITAAEVEKNRYEELDDVVSTIGTSLLGLSLGCARCHEHKFDPIPQGDYYRFAATFTTTVRTEVEVSLDPQAFAQQKAAFQRQHAPLVAALKQYEAEQLPARLAQWEKEGKRLADDGKTQIPDNVRPLLDIASDRRSDEQQRTVLAWFGTIDPQWKKLNGKVQEHLKIAPQLPKALIASEGLPPLRLSSQGKSFFEQTYYLARGDPKQKQGAAQQSFLQVLMTAPDGAAHWQSPPPPGWRTSHRRAALARWITDTEHGAGQLLARVIVNRLWQHHFGRGLVATPSDFGARGEAPTHPELLEWLATALVQEGWHLKPIHKLIMTSAVYMQSADVIPAKAAIDRENRLCWHYRRRRLEGEVIRDTMLAVSGLLDRTLLGPGTLDESNHRRSIYFTVKRSKLEPMMQVFDGPDALQATPVRPTTTVAPQALLLMNNPQVRRYARAFAERVTPTPDTPTEEAVHSAYQIALGRPPTAQELSDATAFLAEQTASYAAANPEGARRRALADVCQTLMCLNEFVYVQ